MWNWILEQGIKSPYRLLAIFVPLQFLNVLSGRMAYSLADGSLHQSVVQGVSIVLFFLIFGALCHALRESYRLAMASTEEAVPENRF